MYAACQINPIMLDFVVRLWQFFAKLEINLLLQVKALINAFSFGNSLLCTYLIFLRRQIEADAESESPAINPSEQPLILQSFHWLLLSPYPFGQQ